MVQVPDPQPGIFMVVGAAELTDATLEGWELVSVLYDDTATNVSTVSPRHVGPNDENTYPYDPAPEKYVVNTSQAVVERSPLFLLRQDTESAVAKIHDQLKEVHNQHMSATKQVDELTAETDRLTQMYRAEIEALQARTETQKKHIGELETGVRNSHKQIQSFTNDIEKLRKALGEIKIREILGE